MAPGTVMRFILLAGSTILAFGCSDSVSRDPSLIDISVLPSSGSANRESIVTPAPAATSTAPMMQPSTPHPSAFSPRPPSPTLLSVPTAMPTTTDPSISVSSTDSRAEAILKLSNENRIEAGLEVLVLNDLLSTAAQHHADDMATQGYFDHVGLDGSTFLERIVATGYTGSAFAENIAQGSDDPSDIMALWMQSSGHRTNILNPIYQDLGIGIATSSETGVVYWVQVFGR